MIHIIVKDDFGDKILGRDIGSRGTILLELKKKSLVISENESGDGLVITEVCPSCTWRECIELDNGICPQCGTDWHKLA